VPASSRASQPGGLRLLDQLSIAYLLFSAAVLLLFGAGVPARWSFSVLYLLLATAVFLIARYVEPEGRRPRSGYALRALVPLILLAWTWGELRILMPLVWSGAYPGTALAVATDSALFGGHPTVMIQALHRDWLDELMAAMYFAYYLFLTVPVVLLVRRQYERALAAASIVAATYFSCFAFFVLVPTKGPRHVDGLNLVPTEFGGYFFGWLVRTLQGAESVVGAALPSSHVAGSVACAVIAAWWLPRLGRVLVPLAAGVAVSTVYLGYHHAVDPLLGTAWGLAGAYLGRAWLRRRDEWPGEA
jgi:membrane-associated phospholipid phosphatase